MTDSMLPDDPCGLDEDSFNEVLVKKTITEDTINDALLVDEKQLSELIKLIGEDTFDAIMEDFKTEITQRFDTLYALQDNMPELARELHIITSCGGNLGMSKFSLLARQMMNKIDHSESFNISLSIDRLKNMYIDSLRLFEMRKR